MIYHLNFVKAIFLFFFTILAFISDIQTCTAKQQISKTSSENVNKKNIYPNENTSTELKQKEFKYCFYPLGIGQYQNKSFLKAKFFMLTQSLAITTFAVSPFVTGKMLSTSGKWALISAFTLYSLSVIDSILFFNPGTSPVQPIFNSSFKGLLFTAKF